MKKKALSLNRVVAALEKIPAWQKAVAGGAAGGLVGGVGGYEAMPRLGGYEDVESARRSAGLMHGLTGALGGAMMAHPGARAGIGKFIKEKPQTLLAIPPTLIAEEFGPMGLAALKRQQESSQAQTAAAQTSSIPLALQQALSSGTAKGIGVGAAGAGLAAILSGLARRQTQDEMVKRKTRGSMIGSDFLKYLLPAVVAGGVVGSLRKGNDANTSGNMQ